MTLPPGRVGSVTDPNAVHATPGEQARSRAVQRVTAGVLGFRGTPVAAPLAGAFLGNKIAGTPGAVVGGLLGGVVSVAALLFGPLVRGVKDLDGLPP